MQQIETNPVEIPPVKPMNGLQRTFLAFRHVNYRYFFFGQGMSLIGTWMQTTALAWQVLQMTHSAWMLGAVGAVQYIPVMVFSLFGGVFADRLPKRKMLFVTQSVALVQAVILWLLVQANTVQIWEIFCLAALLGLSTAFDQPTRQTFVIEMVGREDLPNAVALNSSLVNLARILGPGAGGALIAWLGTAPLFLFNAVSFLAVIFALALMDPRKLYQQERRAEQKMSPVRSIGEGLRYIWSMPALSLSIGVLGVIMMFGINFNVMLPLFATDVLHVGSIGYGLMYSAIGFGALVAAAGVAWRNSQPSFPLLLGSAAVFCIFELAYALSTNLPLSLLLIAGVGAAQLVMTSVAQTMIQSFPPRNLRGRVMSAFLLVYSGGMPVGNLFAGGLATLFSAPVSLFAGGALSLIAAIVGWLMRPAAQRNLDETMVTRQVE